MLERKKIFSFYEAHELQLSIAFFLGGFVFDVFTLSDIDDPLSILQQIAYLLIIGSILFYDFLSDAQVWNPPQKGFVSKVWNYRQLILHFFLGSLLSIYSLFFLKSSSIFSSIIFVLSLMITMILNELKSIQESALNIKIALYVICVFCFFSLIIPVILGFVGWIPFLLSLVATFAFLFSAYKLLLKKIIDKNFLLKRLIAPGSTMSAIFFLFYLFGWIPPVPLSIEKMGIYHKVEKQDGAYVLFHERPWWKVWQSGDQDFKAEPGDKIYLFVSVFSPARFNDSVIVEWSIKYPKLGWKISDKIPMRVTGGRKGGYRGSIVKQNFSDGEWRISVQTTDGRELGRTYFSVTKTDIIDADRTFSQESY